MGVSQDLFASSAPEDKATQFITYENVEWRANGWAYVGV